MEPERNAIEGWYPGREVVYNSFRSNRLVRALASFVGWALRDTERRMGLAPHRTNSVTTVQVGLKPIVVKQGQRDDPEKRLGGLVRLEDVTRE